MSSDPRSVLVTGGAGFIGIHTVRALTARGFRVVVLDDFSGAAAGAREALERMRVRVIAASVDDEGVLIRLLARESPSTILHLAAIVSVQAVFDDPGAAFRTNVAATESLARLASGAGVERMVLASSAAVYGDNPGLLTEDLPPRVALSPYGMHKQLAEACTEGWSAFHGNMKVVILRYFNVYGPGQSTTSPYTGVITRFRARIDAGEPMVVHGDGCQERDFVHVIDVAAANAAAVAGELDSGTYNVCTGEATSISQLAGCMAQQSQRATSIVHAPASQGDIRRSVGDCSRLRTRICWNPRGLWDGLSLAQDDADGALG